MKVVEIDRHPARDSHTILVFSQHPAWVITDALNQKGSAVYVFNNLSLKLISGAHSYLLIVKSHFKMLEKEIIFLFSFIFRRLLYFSIAS